jgi:spermidine synthase
LSESSIARNAAAPASTVDRAPTRVGAAVVHQLLSPAGRLLRSLAQMTPWKTLATVATADGALELRQRGAREFLIVIAGRVLMTSNDRRSEEALATLACRGLTAAGPRVLIGGLGMAYTVRAALDALPAAAQLVVAELTPAVLDWCSGPLAPLTAGAVLDPRVRVVIDDVARLISEAPAGHYDAIVLDLYEGPHAATQRADDPFYGRAALGRCHAALAPGGVLAVWSEEPDEPFARRLAAAGFDVAIHRLGTNRTHVVYLGHRLGHGPKRRRGPG